MALPITDIPVASSRYLQEGSWPIGLALDLAGGKMYWTDYATDKIQRANLDGSGVEDLVTSGLDWPVGIALDLAGGKMYWTDRGTDKIQRASFRAGCEDWCQTEFPDNEAMCRNEDKCKGCAECVASPPPDDAVRSSSQLLGLLLVFCTDPY